jgi:hypothetical protein
MTLKEVLEVVGPLNREQRIQWLIELGSAMTISARAGYPAAGQPVESIPHLIAFNELQHQLFGYMSRSQANDDWTIEKFVEGLCRKAKASGVEGDFGWALKWSLRGITA